MMRSYFFKKYLEIDWGTIGDFFNDKDWYSPKVRIMEWQWDNKILIDINGWPGDNENGAILMNNEIMFTNGNQNLDIINDSPIELRERMDDLAHLRLFDCCEDKHPHCDLQLKKYEKLMPDGDFILDCVQFVSDIQAQFKQYLGWIILK
jgi:hypothetical protein